MDEINTSEVMSYDPRPQTHEIETQTPCFVTMNEEMCSQTRTDSDLLKHLNILKYEIKRKQKTLLKLTNIIETEKNKLEQLKSIKGHFSVRNVTKRDQNATNTRKSLRTSRVTINNLNQSNALLKQQNDELTFLLSKGNAENLSLKQENERLQSESRKKENAQKLNSYYRATVKKLRNSPHSKSVFVDDLKRELQKKKDELEHVMHEKEILQEKFMDLKCCTKNEDGSFRNNVRLCVMELFGLEIAVQK
jgi:predicted RNase H-like nuclease (RuvC/YqgF family)